MLNSLQIARHTWRRWQYVFVVFLALMGLAVLVVPYRAFAQVPIHGGGTGATTAGSARSNLQVLAEVNSAAALEALALSGVNAGDVVALEGYYTGGDMPESTYYLSTSACSLNSGTGDGGSQIPSSTPNNCWLLTAQQEYDPRWWGAVGSSMTGSGSTTNGSTALALTEAGDWQNGQPILVVGAGATYSLGAPTLGTIAPSGATGSTTYCYKIAAIDAAGGIGAATAEQCSMTGPSQLGMAADLRVPNQGMNVPITLPSGAKGVVIYEGASSGAEKFRALFDGSSSIWTDFGHSATAPSATQSRPIWIPNDPLTSPQNDWLQTTITAGAGTDQLTMAASAGATLSAMPVVHNSTAAFTALAATGHSAAVPCGTFNITKTITITGTGQAFNGAGMGCAIIHGLGAQDVIAVGDGSTGNSGGGLNDITLDASDEAAGNGFSVNDQLQTNFNRVEIADPYNCIALGRSTFSHLNVIRCSTDERGQYTVHLYGATAVNQTTYIHQLQNSVSYTAVGFHVDGDVASFFLYDSAIQKTPYKEYLIDNSIGSGSTPSLLQTFNTGFNFCSDNCIDEEVGAQIKWIRTYAQDVTGAGTDTIYIAPGVKNTTIVDSDVFGADKYCIEDHGFVTMIADSAVYACSNPANANASIEVGSDAVGTSISGVGDFNLSGKGAAATSAKALINIEAGANYVQIGPNWGATGQSCDIIDNQGSPNVTIEGLPFGSPPTTILRQATGATLTVASFPDLYNGVGGAIAKFCRSTGNPSAFTDTLDTAANIVSAWTAAGYGITPGFQFRIRVVSAANGIMTLAGGAGVTISGTATTPLSGGLGATVRHDFLCTVTATGTPAINCHG